MTDARPLLAGSLNKYGFGQADKVWEMGGVFPHDPRLQPRPNRASDTSGREAGGEG